MTEMPKKNPKRAKPTDTPINAPQGQQELLPKRPSEELQDKFVEHDEDTRSGLKEALKIFGLIAGVPTVLFTLVNAFFENPVVMIIVALISALIATGFIYQYGKVNLLWVVISWLALVVAIVTITIIWPRTMTVNGALIDKAGKPVVNETVTLIDSSGVSHEVRSDQNGKYGFAAIDSGPFRIKVRDMQVGGGAGGVLVRVLTTDFLTLTDPASTTPGQNVQPVPTYTLYPTFTPAPTQTFYPTQIPYPSQTPYPTPTPMYDFSNINWAAYDDGKGAGIKLATVSGLTSNAVEINYHLPPNGWVVTKKDLNTGSLAKSWGIRFSYQGSGMPNTIELKLIDMQDTIYGLFWYTSTETQGQWKTKVIPYYDLKCWKNTGKCPDDQSLKLKPEEIKSFEFAVSNKMGDTFGDGKLVIDEVKVIP